MIVVGIDPHTRTHTAVAVDRATGEHRGELTVNAREQGHEELLRWARGLDLVGEANRTINRLRWHLHDVDPTFEVPRRRVGSRAWMERLARRLARLEQTSRVRIARRQLRRLRSLAREIKEAEAELAALVRAHAPELLELPGCGTLSAAKLIAE